MGKLTRVTDYYIRFKSKIAGAIELLLNDKLEEIVSIKDFGAKSDGITDDTLAVQSAINACVGKKCIVQFPVGTTLCGSLTVYDDVVLRGRSRVLSELKCKAGTNSDFIVGGNAANTQGAHRVAIERLKITCDPSNTAGSGVTIYGKETVFKSIRVVGFPEHNIHTQWKALDTGVSGMEGFFEDIISEKSGKHGWLFEGPHDSSCSKIIIIDAGQAAEATYDGLSCRGTSANARWSKVHSWTNYGNKRMRCALFCDRDAGGSEFDGSHFEGAQFANVYILANNVTLTSSCKVYYPWGGNNIVLAGSACRIHATLGGEYRGIGLPTAKGIVFAGDYGGVSGSDINIVANGQTAGAMDFGTSAGYNKVIVRGYDDLPSAGYLGTPHAQDEVDLLVSGGTVTSLRKAIRSTNLPVSSISATGSSQSDAAQISEYASFVNVTAAGGSGAGVKLPNSGNVKDGYSITVFNGTGSGVDIKLYPAPFAQFIGKGVNTPITIPFGKAVVVTVASYADGKWMFLIGG